jgi:7,8-dihydropterin-6-yl-methyl-4-(beta-D-ribofuranosyl)aminobenzene 5'-phosphate synthase
MEVVILYDNDEKKGFKKSWGFSCLVGEEVLFDVGADFEKLMFNINKASVNIDKVDKVILSHQHRDHVGGIKILSKLGDVKVFIPKSFSAHFKKSLKNYPNVTCVEVDEAREICEGFFTTGELGRFNKEQSLIVETKNGVSVITGCSHPGLENILEKASSFGDIYRVIGGFHGFNKLEVLREIKLIVPCHCTTKKKKILDIYSRTSMKCSAGCKIQI